MAYATNNASYRRTLEELATKAVRHWPKDITDAASADSVLPRLLETQDKFISVLTLADRSPDAWKALVEVSLDLPANLFLKHLMALTNFGGEALQKVTPFSDYFPNETLHYLWQDREYEYIFQHFIGNRRATSAALKTDGKNIRRAHPLTRAMEDVIMFLLFAQSSSDDALPASLKDQCGIGDLLGQSEMLERFVRQNYIRISRQIAGQTNNTLGQLAQDAVVAALKKELPTWKIERNGKIPGVSVNDGKTDVAFDVVATSPGGKKFGVEVSFQFTGNSVIERKSRDARGLQKNVHAQGGHMCYVIDGAGNIDIRRSAVQTICLYSDCTVAFSPSELNFLTEYMRVTGEE